MTEPTLRERVLAIALRNRDAFGFGCDCHDDLAGLFDSLERAALSTPEGTPGGVTDWRTVIEKRDGYIFSSIHAAHFRLPKSAVTAHCDKEAVNFDPWPGTNVTLNVVELRALLRAIDDTAALASTGATK